LHVFTYLSHIININNYIFIIIGNVTDLKLLIIILVINLILIVNLMNILL